jgi:hypothetical protein
MRLRRHALLGKRGAVRLYHQYLEKYAPENSNSRRSI